MWLVLCWVGNLYTQWNVRGMEDAMTAQKSVIPMNEHGRAITQEDIKPTVLPDAYLTSSIASALVDFKMPRFEDLPTVGLYRDQVIGIVEQTLSPLGTCIDGELLTPSMVNNLWLITM